MDTFALVFLIAALLAGGIAIWAMRTRTRALNLQRMLYESAIAARGDAHTEVLAAREASLTILQEQFDQTNREYAALKTLYRTTQADADVLRRTVGDRDTEVADLQGKLVKDWRGEVKIRCIRHRGKGGTLPICDERKQIEGRYLTYRIQVPHPSGDIFDFGLELVLGLDDEP